MAEAWLSLNAWAAAFREALVVKVAAESGGEGGGEGGGGEGGGGEGAVGSHTQEACVSMGGGGGGGLV